MKLWPSSPPLHCKLPLISPPVLSHLSLPLFTLHLLLQSVILSHRSFSVLRDSHPLPILTLAINTSPKRVFICIFFVCVSLLLPWVVTHEVGQELKYKYVGFFVFVFIPRMLLLSAAFLFLFFRVVKLAILSSFVCVFVYLHVFTLQDLELSGPP